ncbi:hypothetical protein OIO90_001180 [Microbotryomycetes sp. JL221]|nr:hypothetical protein OIO90_001180 [Microbotryomycetes sp. JL221]
MTPKPCWTTFELSTPPSQDATSSAYWNPEQERLHHLRSGSNSSFTNSTLSTSPARPTNASPFRRSDLSDDVAYACLSTTSTPALSCGGYSTTSSEEDDIDTSMTTTTTTTTTRSSSRKAHPLTLQPSLESSWDYERLFSKKRTWFGGVRTFEQDDGKVESDIDAISRFGNIHDNDQEIETRGRTMIKKRTSDKYRKSGLRHQVDQQLPSTLPQQEHQEVSNVGTNHDDLNDNRLHQRQQEVFETMRKAAMDRLNLLSAHLAWSGQSTLNKR